MAEGKAEPLFPRYVRQLCSIIISLKATLVKQRNYLGHRQTGSCEINMRPLSCLESGLQLNDSYSGDKHRKWPMPYLTNANFSNGQ